MNARHWLTGGSVSISHVDDGRGLGSGAAPTAIASLLLGVGLAPFSAQSAETEAAETQPTGGIETVVVTARYKEESLQETPLAITAVTAEMIESRGFTNVAQVSAVAPNVVLQQQGVNSGKALTAFIRGIGQSDFNFALEPGVGIYMDDVYLGTLYGSILGLADVERIEVLRGPQGTLFGKNSEGGAIRLYSVKPKGDNSGFVDAGYGSYDRVQVRGALDVPLVEGKLALRVVGGSNSVDGYMDVLDFACAQPALAGRLPQRTTNPDCKVGTLGGIDARFVRGQLRFTPTDDLDINLSIMRNQDNGEATAEKLIANPGSPLLTGFNNSYALPTYGVAQDTRFITPEFYQTYVTGVDLQTGMTMPNKATVDEVMGIATVDWTTGWGPHLKSVSSYRHYTGSFSLQQGGSPLLYLGIYNPVKHTAYTQEFNLTDTTEFGSSSIDWTIGLHYYDGESTSGGWVDLAAIPLPIPGVPALRFTQDNIADDEAKSAFVHVDYNITDRWSIELGYRYTDEEKTFEQNQFFIDGGGTPTSIRQVPFSKGVSPMSRSDWKAGLSFRWTPDLMVYANAATGFKSGGSNPRPLSPQDAVPFGPEEVIAYEMGAKFQGLDQRLRLNTAIFQSDYTDLQTNGLVEIPGSNPPLFSTRLSNFGEVQIRGFELELTLEPVDGLQIDGNYGYLDYEVQDVGNATGFNLDSKQLYVPKNKYAIGMQYAFGLGGAGNLTPRIDYMYQDEVVTDAFQTGFSTEPSRNLVNASLSYVSPSGDWTVMLEGTNLADEEYNVSRVVSVVPFGTADSQPGRPREYFFSVRRNFQ